jgi:hypothetical protein
VAVLFLLLGLVLGFVSLALGPLGLIEALIVLVVVLLQLRRFPERVGAYLVGMAIFPLAILTAVVTHVPSCGQRSGAAQCYYPVTLFALGAYAVAALVGLAMLGMAGRSMVRQPNGKAPTLR